MSRFAKVVIAVVLFLVFMVVLTYTSPAINEYAKGLAASSKLPLWIVGLLAPILYVFKKIGDLFSGIFGESGTEKSIRQSNEAIRVRLAELERDVARLDEWRTTEVTSRMNRINDWEQRVASMRGRATEMDEQLVDLLQRDDQAQQTTDQLLVGIADLQRAIDELRNETVEDPDR